MKKETLQCISQTIKTPSYVFECKEFADIVANFKEKMGDAIGMCYSVKANPFLIDDSIFKASKIFDKFEVCSPGELHICMNYGIKPDIILFSGINKVAKDIEEAYLYGVRMFTVESYNHLQFINSVGKKFGEVISCLIRVSADSQFGMDEIEVETVIQQRSNYNNIRIDGIHYFTGTQKRKEAVILKEIEYIKEFCHRIKYETGFSIRKVEYGIGLNVKYFKNETSTFPLDNIIEALMSLSKEVELTVEMGRFFASSCGYYFTTVVDCKCNNGTNYAIVDGGMNQLHYDGQMRNMKEPIHEHIKCLKNDNMMVNEQREWTICGSICSTEDVICRNALFDGLSEGDVLVFKQCGAYSFMEGMSTFLSREMPQIWAYTNEDRLLLLRDFIYTENFNCKKP